MDHYVDSYQYRNKLKSSKYLGRSDIIRLKEERGLSPTQLREARKRKTKARRRRKIRRATQQAMRK